MQPITLIVAALLGLAGLAFVLYPLYRHPRTAPLALATATGDDILSANTAGEREQTARQALREVEFDFQLGNLDEPEYRALRNRYLDRAAREMQQRHQREQSLDDAIEAELHQLKQKEEERDASE